MLCLRLYRCFPAWAVCVGVLFCLGNARPALAETIMDGKSLLAMGRESNLCALTFDDGPSRHTPRLLDILRERGLRATFFVVGSQVRYHPQIIQRMRDEGHEIANHTNSHVTLRHLSREMQRNEISAVQSALERLGVTSRFIRPPYGRYDKETLQVAKEQGVRIMLWSVDSMDWMQKVRIENMKTLVSGQKLRGVFLFHDTHAPTVDAMPSVLDQLIAEGCQFVTVSEFMEALENKGMPDTVLVEKQKKSEEAVPAGMGLERGTEPVPMSEQDGAVTERTDSSLNETDGVSEGQESLSRQGMQKVFSPRARVLPSTGSLPDPA